MIDERDIAIREANEVTTVDAFFAARPHLDNMFNRKLFEDGFRRGWTVGREEQKASHEERNYGGVVFDANQPWRPS